MPVEIMQVPSLRESDPRKYMTMLHGIAGVGKTTWAKQIDGHYFLQTEIGTEGVESFGHPVLDWKEFGESCAKLVEQKHSGWKDVRKVTTIVIDRLELLYDYCGTHLCQTSTFPEKGVQLKFERIEDVPWGKGYKRTNKVLIANLNKLLLYGFGIVLICQTKERIIKWKGEDCVKFEPNLPPAACLEIVATCGAVGHFVIVQELVKDIDSKIVVDKEERQSFWQPKFLRIAKHRLTGFPDSIKLNLNTMYQDYIQVFQETLDAQKAEGGETTAITTDN